MSASFIACFGEALVDLLSREPPETGAPRQFTEYAGGAPANVAVAVARLGGRARFIGMLGEDLFGDRLLAELQRAGVDVGCVRRTSEAKTALAFVSLDARGERSFSFYRPPGRGPPVPRGALRGALLRGRRPLPRLFQQPHRAGDRRGHGRRHAPRA